MMVVRIWRGRILSKDADAYYPYIEETGLRAFRNTPGNRGAFLLRRGDGEIDEMLVVSLWDSLESIGAFAGDDIERAVYYPEDEKYLLELDPNVTHYDVLEHWF